MQNVILRNLSQVVTGGDFGSSDRMICCKTHFAGIAVEADMHIFYALCMLIHRAVIYNIHSNSH